jgi:hypothetical protein
MKTDQELQHFEGSQLMKLVDGKMHELQLVSIVNLIQMKLAYRTDNSKNTMNKEFQHCEELQLIEVLSSQMRMIQIVLPVNLLQMKLMKSICILQNMKNQELLYDLGC